MSLGGLSHPSKVNWVISDIVNQLPLSDSNFQSVKLTVASLSFPSLI
jgi:hypothetical protein